MWLLDGMSIIGPKLGTPLVLQSDNTAENIDRSTIII
jgi:hypothetical protein